MIVTWKMLMEIVLVGCTPICCIPLATFVVVPPESESISCGACDTEYHKPYTKKGKSSICYHN